MDSNSLNAGRGHIRSFKVNCGEIPINLIFKGLESIKMDHNGSVYVFGKKVYWFNGLRIEYVPYLVKSVKNEDKSDYKTDLKDTDNISGLTVGILDKIKLDSDFKPKIDKSKLAGVRVCVACNKEFNVYFEVKGKIKRLVSDVGVLTDSGWACWDCHYKVFGSTKTGDLLNK